jgi:hypothetical protein
VKLKVHTIFGIILEFLTILFDDVLFEKVFIIEVENFWY